ncbi:histone H1-II-like [Uloborus diversus]|uniref:histone H1-II-like n=1 Tax=Uloborus diversus TaxID=327109 RepID=UPI0024095B3A|nr:histone H1-II-like [Uloborus diversus]
MAETTSPAASPAKKTKAAGKAKKPKVAPTHPKVADMVNTAISTLKERGGSSLQAIKKYIGAHYKVDLEKLSPFIRKYLKSAVASGNLVQTKGKGASGSFRIGSAAGAKGASTAAKPKKSPAKKAAKPKKEKAAASPKKAAKPKKAAVKKTPKKASPVKKAKPAAKKAKPAKSPKPKKAAAKKASPKKGKK